MTREPFPFMSHLTLSEVARVEHLREHCEDAHLITHHSKYIAFRSIDRARLIGYLARNPRKQMVAA